MSKPSLQVRRQIFADLRDCGFKTGRVEATRSKESFSSYVSIQHHPSSAKPGEECFDVVYEAVLGTVTHRSYLGEMVSAQGAWFTVSKSADATTAAVPIVEAFRKVMLPLACSIQSASELLCLLIEDSWPWVDKRPNTIRRFKTAWELAAALENDDALQQVSQQLRDYAATSRKAREQVEFLLTVLPDPPSDFWSTT